MRMRTMSVACPITIVPRSIEAIHQLRNITRNQVDSSGAAVSSTNVTLSILRKISAALPPANCSGASWSNDCSFMAHFKPSTRTVAVSTTMPEKRKPTHVMALDLVIARRGLARGAKRPRSWGSGLKEDIPYAPGAAGRHAAKAGAAAAGRKFTKRQCQRFVIAVEDYLASHPGALPTETPPALGTHGQECARCRGHWDTAYCSRVLLASLLPVGKLPVDECFHHDAYTPA